MADKQQLVPYSPGDSSFSYGNQTFEHLADLISFIDSLPERDRYTAQSDVLTAMVQAHIKVADHIEEFFEYTRRSSAYQLHLTEAEFAETWAEASQIVEDNRGRRDRLQEARANILKLWTTAHAVSWINRPEHARNILAAVRPLAKEMTFEQAVPLLNCAILGRFLFPARGVAKIRGPTAGDIGKVRDKTVQMLDIKPEYLVDNNLRYGIEGILEFDDGTGAQAIRDASRAAKVVEGGSGGSAPSQMPQDGWPLEAMGDFSCPAGETPNAPSSDVPMSDEPLHSASCDSTPGTCDNEHLDDIAVDIGLIEDAEQDLLEEQAAQVTSAEDEEPGQKRRRLDVRTQDTSKCSCSNDVPKAWKKSVMQKRALGLAADMKQLDRMQQFERVCYAHAKAIGGHVGLMVKRLDYQQLIERLKDVHENRLRLGRLKTDPATFSWFRVANRPARPSDMLGPYKFVHQSNAIFDYDQEMLRERLGVDVNTWCRDGSVNLSLFDWWFRGPIGNIIHHEFNMYRHHLREINGKPNYGWLRNSFYSIGQQLMRQDPVYYALYAALRPDKQWRLVSYPYYAKYAVKGDQTYFRHIDLNIPDLINSNRGACMIQGSVSLDDESDADCTVILAGMQNKLQEWWNICVARGQETSGFVHRITEQMFTPEDAQRLAVDWKRVPCRQGAVRVTLPHIPHGSDGPSAGTRRTMLPWFVGVQDDHEALEVIEGGTWSDLSAAHRDLTAPKATPSGLANRYGAIPYRFPAAVEVSGLGALSDALVCRRGWNSPAVLHERDIILGGSLEAFKQYIEVWRTRATKAAQDAFALVQQEERRVFGSRSYFYHLKRLEQEGIPFPDIMEDPEELDPEACKNDPTVQFRFAEEGVVSSSEDGD